MRVNIKLNHGLIIDCEHKALGIYKVRYLSNVVTTVASC